MKKFKESGTIDTLPGSGRKPKQTPRLTRKICREINMKHRILLKDIAEYLKGKGIQISTSTIQQKLNKNVLESDCKRKVPLFMPCHIKAHLMGLSCDK